MSVLAFVARLLVGVAIVLGLIGFCFSFLILTRNVEAQLPRARTWARRVYVVSRASENRRVYLTRHNISELSH